MNLEQMPSRAAALENRHALAVGPVRDGELEPFLLPFLSPGFAVQARVLFEHGEEARRQWLFVDRAGNVRLNAVFRPQSNGPAGGSFAGLAFPAAGAPPPPPPAETPAGPPAEGGYPDGGYALGSDLEPEEGEGPPAGFLSGFIEVFDEGGRIVREHLFAENGSETVTAFFYSGGVLVRAETSGRGPGDPAGEFQGRHVDHYRYNRSFALRYVERVFYDASAEPVRLEFPFRALEAAVRPEESFVVRDTPGTEFMDTIFMDDLGGGLNMRYETDPRGRVLSQAMLDDYGGVLWEIRNTWLDDRIVATTRSEGGEERRTEFEFDRDGNRVVQREIRGGVVERVVRYQGGGVEIEELFMDGILVLRARWENGRRVSEERVRRP